MCRRFPQEIAGCTTCRRHQTAGRHAPSCRTQRSRSTPLPSSGPQAASQRPWSTSLRPASSCRPPRLASPRPEHHSSTLSMASFVAGRRNAFRLPEHLLPDSNGIPDGILSTVYYSLHTNKCKSASGTPADARNAGSMSSESISPRTLDFLPLRLGCLMCRAVSVCVWHSRSLALEPHCNAAWDVSMLHLPCWWPFRGRCCRRSLYSASVS